MTEEAAGILRMPEFIGVDTSNYTTSVAVFSSDERKIYQAKKLLPVKKGELGLRQSDAVFHHTKQLPEMVEELFGRHDFKNIKGISASVRPRNTEGSYMPCFLCGEGFVRSFSAINNIPMYRTSHQVGHVLAALYSGGRLDLVNEKFIAFHVSGGTTDCLLCQPDKENVLNITQVGTSLDLKAGQAVDRVGMTLGLSFPCGIELEKLAVKSQMKFKPKPVIKGCNCCISGLENQCGKMLMEGGKPEDIARFCLEYISSVIISMTTAAVEKAGKVPLIYAGGVMSDKIIKENILKIFPEAVFASPEFSCDNGAGTAIFGYLKSQEK